MSRRRTAAAEQYLRDLFARDFDNLEEKWIASGDGSTFAEFTDHWQLEQLEQLFSDSGVGRIWANVIEPVGRGIEVRYLGEIPL